MKVSKLGSILASVKRFIGSSGSGSPPVLSKLASRKFLTTLIPVIAGLVGIDKSLLWALVALAGLYIVGNVGIEFIRLKYAKPA